MVTLVLMYYAYANASDFFLSLLPIPRPFRGSTPYVWSGEAGYTLIPPNIDSQLTGKLSVRTLAMPHV